MGVKKGVFMAKKGSIKELIVPNILGLEADIAGDILDDLGIKYEIQEKQIITLLCDKNCVAKTTPKKNSVIKSDETLKIYTSKFKILPSLIILIILIAGLVYFLNKTSVTPLFGGEPEISSSVNGWSDNNIVYITDDAVFNYSEVDHYKYCISKTRSSSECDWKDTYTKSIRLSNSGTWFVWFKGISINNDESSTSNRLKVQIDNESPSITTIDKVIASRSIEVKLDAKDNLSGVDKYYYSINDSEFIEDNKSHTFTSLDENTLYTINMRVVDKAGNYIDSSIKLSTSSSNKGDTSSTTINRVIPQISMNDIPSYITVGDKYTLPTSITPNKNKEYLTCRDENNNTLENTFELAIGKHQITCDYSYDNMTIKTYKTINVLIDNGSDKVFDNNVRLNLDYPEDARVYMYRFITNDVRLDEDKWNYYVEPLYINKNDVNNIMIKYELDGEQIVTTNNDLYIDIRPESYKVKDNEETEVSIKYQNKEDTVYYSVNGSMYNEYKNSFKVKGNTLINAYILRSVKVYDEKSNSIVYKTIRNNDSVYIESISSTIGDKSNTDINISLDGIPDIINNDKVYSIPSSYTFGIHGNYIISCSSDNKIINSTSDLPMGNHDITCTLTALDGETITVSKNISVQYDNYKYDLDNIPSTIEVGYDYELDNKCNISNTNRLKEGKNIIKCGNVSKTINVVKNNNLSIDLDNIPDTISVGDLYPSPSHYHGNNISYIKCIDENKNLLYNTSTLSIGEHNITCSIKAGNEVVTITRKISVTKPKYTIDILK